MVFAIFALEKRVNSFIMQRKRMYKNGVLQSL